MDLQTALYIRNTWIRLSESEQNKTWLTFNEQQRNTHQLAYETIVMALNFSAPNPVIMENSNTTNTTNTTNKRTSSSTLDLIPCVIFMPFMPLWYNTPNCF